jgi:small acid-soluble spore protein H (minor)
MQKIWMSKSPSDRRHGEWACFYNNLCRRLRTDACGQSSADDGKMGIIMDINRAKEIVSSPVMAKVTCNGSEIYIDSVNEGNNTAVVHPIGQHGSKNEVPLTSLTEQ